MKKLFVFITIILTIGCENNRPYKVVNVNSLNDSTCKYVLSRSNGFGPQVKTITARCGKYQLFQTINQ